MVRLIDDCESKVTTTNPRSKSLRTTIPTEIRTLLKLKAGSTLRWCVDITDGKIVATIEKLE